MFACICQFCYQNPLSIKCHQKHEQQQQQNGRIFVVYSSHSNRHLYINISSLCVLVLVVLVQRTCDANWIFHHHFHFFSCICSSLLALCHCSIHSIAWWRTPARIKILRINPLSAIKNLNSAINNKHKLFNGKKAEKNSIISQWMRGKRWKIPLFENGWNASDDGKNGRKNPQRKS